VSTTAPGTAGYSGKPLPEKLGLKPGLTVYVDGGPADLDELLGGASYTTRLPKHVDVTLLFATSRARVLERLPVVVERTSTVGMVWVCWPKRASKVSTDLSDDVVRGLRLSAGLVDVKVVAVDDTWSGLKLVRRLRDR
jgi:hypothetical protein